MKLYVALLVVSFVAGALSTPIGMEEDENLADYLANNAGDALEAAEGGQVVALKRHCICHHHVCLCTWSALFKNGNKGKLNIFRYFWGWGEENNQHLCGTYK